MILFSDAVFAIAITLLIIEIKFPETPENVLTANYWKVFRPTLIQFGAFALSFFFVGTLWAKHLRLCRQMKHYDQGVILGNLIFLFFIVTFPFTAKGLAEHIKPNYLIPIFIYVVNIACCNLAHTWLCYYIFYRKPHLSIPGEQDEKKYIYLRSKYFSILLLAVICMATVVTMIFPNNVLYFALTLYAVPVLNFYIRKKLKK